MVVISPAQKQTSKALRGKRGIAFLLLGLFLFVQAMTQFESLHHAAHSDSHQPNHQCAVTMLQGGQVDVPTCQPICVPVPALIEVPTPHAPNIIFVSFDFTLLPSCGPPALLS